jgi:hypothetical protein
MNEPIPEFLAKFDKIAGESAVFMFITRDTDLQRQACSSLNELLVQIGDEKASAIARLDEDYANTLLGCHCVAKALVSEITMWILLKESRPDKAWDMLVAAQMALAGALRAHKMFAHLEAQVQRLGAIERLIFPPQVFLSSGMIVATQTCSICGQEYEDCPHVKGRPYLGEFCYVWIVPSEVDHVAMVHDPADKSCRIIKFTAEGGYRNRMTWLVEAAEGGVEHTKGDFVAQGILGRFAESGAKGQSSPGFADI